MKTLLISALLGIASMTQAATLQVRIVDVDVPEGKLMIKLVDSKDAYDGKAKAVQARMIDVTAKGDVELSFEDLAPGNYAIMIMHDENSNGKLDSNILGIPKEGYGFSNNPRVMRQPTFEETRFEVKDGEQTISINII